MGGVVVSDLAEFVDSRCARFVRDARYRVALMRERFQDEAIAAEGRRKAAEYKKRKRKAA